MFPYYVDPVTKKKVFQLTSQKLTPGNNYGLYYHQNNWNGGYYLIYRNLADGVSSASLTYYRLDLEDGTTTTITPTGDCNGAMVRGNYLYTFYLGHHVSRFDIRTPIQPPAPESVLCDLDLGWEPIGDIAVNRNSTCLIFLQKKDSIRQAYKYNIATGRRTLLINTTEEIEHFQFSPTNAQWYTYINQSNRGLERIGVGRIDTEQNSKLFSNDSFLNSFSNYPHPFYGKDGHLWSDAIGSNQLPQNYVIRFTFGGGRVGSIQEYKKVPIDDNQWQVHFNAAHDGNWFIGDGQGYETSLGEPFINRLLLNAWHGSSMVVKLACAVGTYERGPGHRQASAHYIESKNWVVWSAFRTLQGSECDTQNVFAVDFW